jgi:energy-coupling factor transporter ATP-binding protein EcfA2
MQDPHASWFNVAVGNVGKASSESLATIRDKVSQHEFSACVRLGISKGVSNATFYSILSALKTLESAGVRINAINESPEAVNNTHIPWRFPLRLSVKEVANFLMLPVGDTELAGVARAHPKLILPPAWYKNPSAEQDRTFAISGNTRLGISPKDALEHTVILGPTGSGKSTAMLNLIMSDINAGRSVLVIDPKADLVNEVLERMPEECDKDTIILDPSDPCPAGLNAFFLKGYGNYSLVADAVFAVFKEIFAENWGIRTQEALSAAFLTLAQTKGATLLWLPKLLTDEVFRKKITAGLKDKIGLIPYWENFNAMKESERRAEVAPVLNKINSFMFRQELRNVLGQSEPKFSLTDLFNERKIILVPLNKGTIGSENARFLGSLIVGLTWTLALSRANIPKEERHMVSVFIDELQDYLTLPTDLSDALAQARGLGVSLTMAHQYRDQLPPKIRAGIDANARNKIIFGLTATDAKEIAANAPGLEAVDFMALPRYSVYASFMNGGISTGWVSGKTLPATPAKRLPSELRAKSMVLYGKPAEETEAEYLALFTPTETAPPSDEDLGEVGRKKIL